MMKGTVVEIVGACALVAGAVVLLGVVGISEGSTDSLTRGVASVLRSVMVWR